MSEVEDVMTIAADWKREGEQVAIATVTETWGSSPRPAGSQLVVTRSGRMAGSVSGGCTGLAVWPNAIDYFSHFLDIDYRTMTLLCVTTFLTLAAERSGSSPPTRWQSFLNFTSEQRFIRC